MIGGWNFGERLACPVTDLSWSAESWDFSDSCLRSCSKLILVGWAILGKDRRHRGCTGVGSGDIVKFYWFCCIWNSGFGIWFTIHEPPCRPNCEHFDGPPVRICGVFGVRRHSFPLRKFICVSFACMFLLPVTSPGSLYYCFCNVNAVTAWYSLATYADKQESRVATCSVNTALGCRSHCSVLVCFSVFHAPAVNVISLCTRCVHSNLLYCNHCCV